MKKILLLTFLLLSVMSILKTLNPGNVNAQSCGINIDPTNPGGFPTPASVAGSGFVRIEFKDCTQSNIDLPGSPLATTINTYRGVIDGYGSLGIRTILILDYMSYPSARTNIPGFAERAGIIAAAFGSNVDYEIWNEPDLGQGGNLTPAEFAQILGPVAGAIKSNGGGTVIVGALASGQPSYLSSLRAAMGGGWSNIDGVGIHPYGKMPSQVPPCNIGSTGDLGAFLNANATAGGKPIWITEIGLDSTDQNLQSTYLTCFYRVVRTAHSSQVANITWFAWSDEMVPPFGIIESSIAPKASYNTYFTNACGVGVPGSIQNQAAISFSIDPGVSCSAGGGTNINPQAGQPVPPPYINCGETAYPQFHSLRPYQSSPCNIDTEPAHLYCGNDFITQQIFEVDPDGAAVPIAGGPMCTDNGGSVTCNFSQPSGPINVNIDLSNSEFPIMGNTELVPNQINDGPNQPNLAYNARTGDYVSWYLNGTIYNFEEENNFSNLTQEEKEKVISTYSGPLNKLLPFQMQLIRRYKQYLRIGRTRHDQLVTDGTWLSEYANPIQQELLRENGQPNTYPAGQYHVYNNIPMAETEDRLGNVEVYRGYDGRNPSNGVIPANPVQPPCPAGSTNCAQNVDIINVNLQFNNNLPHPTIIPVPTQMPTSYEAGDADRIYPAHLDEDKGLAVTLSTTFLPSDIPANRVRFLQNYNQQYYNTGTCDIPDAKANPGDDLFGNYINDRITNPATPRPAPYIDPQSIQGTFSYNASFQCTFTKRCHDGQCNPTVVGPNGSTEDRCTPACQSGCSDQYANCPGTAWQECANADPILQEACCSGHETSCNNTCESDCRVPSCNAAVAATPFSVYTRIPQIDEIWGRTVESPQSIFRRIYPKIEPAGNNNNSINFDIEDTPGYTFANYSSSTPGVTANAANIARPGSAANIFFPHLGGIHDYFLVGIREALLPYTGTQTTRPEGERNQPTTFPPGTDPLFCNWDSTISSCHWYSPNSTQCISDSTNPNAPIGYCPTIDIVNGVRTPHTSDVTVGGTTYACGDPVCEGGRCNPYEWGQPKDYVGDDPNNPRCSAAQQPDNCALNCQRIDIDDWNADTYRFRSSGTPAPIYTGCRYATGPICVRNDGYGGCAGVCNSVCCSGQ
jgi:hypothetical protein